MRRRVDVNKGTSNTWLILALFLIVFFLYQYMYLNSIVTMNLYDYEMFWISSEQTGATVLSQFYVIFILFMFWASLEIYAAIKNNYSDKYFCLGICSILILTIAFSQMTFSKNEELFETQYRIRTNKPITFRLTEIPHIPQFTKWDEFKWLKLREKRHHYYYRFLDSDWEQLEQEFIESGGLFEPNELEHLRIIPTTRNKAYIIEYYWFQWYLPCFPIFVIVMFIVFFYIRFLYKKKN